MKPVDIVQDANKNLSRNKGRTILTVVAIFIGAMTLTITNGIGSGVSEYIDQQLGNIGADDMLIVQAKRENPGSGPQKYEEDKGSGGNSDLSQFITMLDDNDVSAIREVSGVVSAEPQTMVRPDYIEGANEVKYKLDLSPFVTGTNLALAEGKSPDNESPAFEIVLLPDFPKVLGYDSARAAVGKRVAIGVTAATGQQSEVVATVVGVQEEALTSLGGASGNEALVSELHRIQTEGQPESVTERYPVVLARVDKAASEAEVMAIKNKLGDRGYEAVTIQDQIGVFKQVIDAIITVLNAFAGIALLAASFGIVNTLLMAVQERTKEIGLMKAMGMGGRKIFFLFSLEAILLGFWGSLLGSLAGIGIGLVANRIASNTFLKDLPGFQLTSFSPQSVGIIMLIIMVIAFLAGTLPARRASRKDPIEALRYE